MNQTPHLLICGNYGATNLGDEAILQSILQFSSSAFPDAKIKVVSSDPELTAKQYDVETVPMIPAGFRSFIKAIFGGGIRKTMKAYKHADAVIFGGGGLFTDEKPPAIFIWMMQIFPAVWYKKPIFCFGQSVGPLMMRTSRWAVQYIFKKMKIVTVRDQASKKILSTMGVKNIHVLPDPVFGLHTHKTHDAQREKYIVFSLRPWMKNAEKIYPVLASFVDWVYGTYHLKTYFVPFQLRRDDDESESLRVFSKVESHDAAEVFSHNANISDIMKLMEQATAVVGMRLHSLIFSTLTHTPFLALSYSLKVKEVVNQLGMDDYFCEYRFLELADMKKKFEKLFSERRHIEKALEDKHHELAKKTEQYSELLGTLFNRHLE